VARSKTNSLAFTVFLVIGLIGGIPNAYGEIMPGRLDAARELHSMVAQYRDEVRQWDSIARFLIANKLGDQAETLRRELDRIDPPGAGDPFPLSPSMISLYARVLFPEGFALVESNPVEESRLRPLLESLTLRVMEGESLEIAQYEASLANLEYRSRIQQIQHPGIHLFDEDNHRLLDSYRNLLILREPIRDVLNSDRIMKRKLLAGDIRESLQSNLKKVLEESVEASHSKSKIREDIPNLAEL